MEDSEVRANIARGDSSIEDDPFRITAAGMVLPLPVHFVFNAVGALSVVLLGFPILALAAFTLCGVSDIIFQRLIARWL